MPLRLGTYSSASMQASQSKTLLCNELGQKQDLKLYRNHYKWDYQIILKFGTLIECILFMTTCNFQCTSLFLSKVVRVKNKKDNQGFKEMKGPMPWLQLTSDPKNIGLENSKNHHLCILCYQTSGLSRRIAFFPSEYTKTWKSPMLTQITIFSHSTNLSYALFVGFVMQGHICPSSPFCVYLYGFISTIPTQIMAILRSIWN